MTTVQLHSPIIMKCFEKLVRTYIVSTLPPSFDPYQFACRAKRATEDAIATALHSALCHLDQRGSYARLLFVDFSSAFNTILPDRLVNKLLDLGISHSICLWIKDFLSDRPQKVIVGCHYSSCLSLSTGSPQGYVLSPLLYTLTSWLHPHPFQQHHHQVCWWCHRGGAHLWGRWVCISGRSGAAVNVVYRKQPGSEYYQDQGTDYWLQEKENGHSAPVHQWGLCGEDLQFPIPGHPSQRWTDLEHQHHCCHQEGTSETVLSENSWEKSTCTETAGVLLPRASSHTASVCGFPDAQSQRGRRSRGSSTWPKRLSDVPSPPWKTGTVRTVLGRQIIFSEIHLTPDTLTLNCCLQADVTD